MVDNLIEALSRTLRFSDNEEVASVFSEVTYEMVSELIQTFTEDSKIDLLVSKHRVR